MLEFADDVSQRHTTPDEVKTSIPALDELSIHGQPTFSLSYARRTRCRPSAAVPTCENGCLNRVRRLRWLTTPDIRSSAIDCQSVRYEVYSCSGGSMKWRRA